MLQIDQFYEWFLGQGTFGKVYTAINNVSGDIMAMKEIPLQPNDHKTLRSVAEELRQSRYQEFREM